MKQEYEYNKIKITVETTLGSAGKWQYRALVFADGINGVNVGRIPAEEFETEEEALKAGKARAEYRVDNRFVKPIASN